MSYNDKLITILLCLIIVTITNTITCLVWQHKCVLHHAAFFESNTWGVTQFKWEDNSYAHQPFQDDTWEKIQAKLFQEKMEKLGLH